MFLSLAGAEAGDLPEQSKPIEFARDEYLVEREAGARTGSCVPEQGSVAGAAAQVANSRGCRRRLALGRRVEHLASGLRPRYFGRPLFERLGCLKSVSTFLTGPDIRVLFTSRGAVRTRGLIGIAAWYAPPAGTRRAFWDS